MLPALAVDTKETDFPMRSQKRCCENSLKGFVHRRDDRAFDHGCIVEQAPLKIRMLNTGKRFFFIQEDLGERITLEVLSARAAPWSPKTRCGSLRPRVGTVGTNPAGSTAVKSYKRRIPIYESMGRTETFSTLLGHSRAPSDAERTCR